MKRPLKLNRAGSCMYFAVAAAIALSFLGCKTREVIIEKEVLKEIRIPIEKPLIMIPLIDDIITEVGGLDKTPDFQYYISKTITLSLVAGQSDSTIEVGQVVRRGSTTRNNVTISAYTPGILQTYQSGTSAMLGNRLNIAFEDYEGTPVVPFARQGSAGRYEILYADRPNSIINYGGKNYTVNYNGSELPYLMVTIQETAIESDSSRRVTGLTLDRLVRN